MKISAISRISFGNIEISCQSAAQEKQNIGQIINLYKKEKQNVC